MKTQLQTWLETDVTSYTYRGRTYYETLSRDLYFKNVGITKGSFELYRSDIFNFNSCPIFWNLSNPFNFTIFHWNIWIKTFCYCFGY